ncbi:hypothetical protein HYH03_014792 [Edaphochlamys debaryana]|uniref:Guanylate cyclase domain-containing protein n=1 Tax=Edaphochlamys debaryana TaxID=47281 RepID=A0A836BT51_9CHLO|nr:hypothetical protein HYH03_014792 [Edaphochlamys debaryana]|eukprot:KAG2486489.1 hypothetical protein HYH03_014792 [Edaphochlamys debaryana]
MAPGLDSVRGSAHLAADWLGTMLHGRGPGTATTSTAHESSAGLVGPPGPGPGPGPGHAPVHRHASSAGMTPAADGRIHPDLGADLGEGYSDALLMLPLGGLRHGSVVGTAVLHHAVDRHGPGEASRGLPGSAAVHEAVVSLAMDLGLLMDGPSDDAFALGLGGPSVGPGDEEAYGNGDPDDCAPRPAGLVFGSKVWGAAMDPATQSHPHGTRHAAPHSPLHLPSHTPSRLSMESNAMFPAPPAGGRNPRPPSPMRPSPSRPPLAPTYQPLRPQLSQKSLLMSAAEGAALARAVASPEGAQQGGDEASRGSDPARGGLQSQRSGSLAQGVEARGEQGPQGEAGPAESKQEGRVGRAAGRTRAWAEDVRLQCVLQWKIFREIVRRKPSILLLSLALCGLLCGLGVFGVLYAAEQSADSQKASAYAREAVASATANSISGQLEIATFAVMTMSAYLTQQPWCRELNRTFANISQVILDWDDKRLVYQVQALPAARLNYIYPPITGDLAAVLYGRDLLEVPMYREDTLTQIRSRDQRLMLGPYHLLEGFLGMFATYPVFLPAPNATFDWGCGVQPHDCGEGVCWLPEQGLKLWGLATSVISLDNMQADFRFAALDRQGYVHRLHQVASGFNGAAVISASSPPPRDPVSVTINKFNLVWVLEVSPQSGWAPAWRNPCIAAVVVGSVLAAALVMGLMVAREKHDMLLHAMLPRKVIRRLQRGEQTVVEEFLEPVTILFSDIVSYTEVASQLTPLQVVRLLNELYTCFDALCDVHGVYKVETIGDAFMCVAGCPTRENPVDAAVRMAGMAKDMVAMVESFRTRVGDEEMQVKIRVGLHSGPVVAGVIGQRMPRYCLFGDTVNTASRMETNSAPMCIHMSAATASLLRQAGSAVVLPPRPSRPAAPPSPLQSLAACLSSASASALVHPGVYTSQRFSLNGEWPHHHPSTHGGPIIPGLTGGTATPPNLSLLLEQHDQAAAGTAPGTATGELLPLHRQGSGAQPASPFQHQPSQPSQGSRPPSQTGPGNGVGAHGTAPGPALAARLAAAMGSTGSARCLGQGQMGAPGGGAGGGAGAAAGGLPPHPLLPSAARRAAALKQVYLPPREGAKGPAGNLVLYGRGRTNIKGKGFMHTFWLNRPPPTFPSQIGAPPGPLSAPLAAPSPVGHRPHSPPPQPPPPGPPPASGLATSAQLLTLPCATITASASEPCSRAPTAAGCRDRTSPATAHAHAGSLGHWLQSMSGALRSALPPGRASSSGAVGGGAVGSVGGVSAALSSAAVDGTVGCMPHSDAATPTLALARLGNPSLAPSLGPDHAAPPASCDTVVLSSNLGTYITSLPYVPFAADHDMATAQLHVGGMAARNASSSGHVEGMVFRPADSGGGGVGIRAGSSGTGVGGLGGPTAATFAAIAEEPSVRSILSGAGAASTPGSTRETAQELVVQETAPPPPRVGPLADEDEAQSRGMGGVWAARGSLSLSGGAPLSFEGRELSLQNFARGSGFLASASGPAMAAGVRKILAAAPEEGLEDGQ